MGAVVSMNRVYSDAMEWFKQYFDRLSYLRDYGELDIHLDGILTYEMVKTWINTKSKDGSFWSILCTTESIVKIAFNVVSVPHPEHPKTHVIQGMNGFRSFLIHLFVLGILWTHFKHADEWTDESDIGSERLSFQKFKMACRTFSCSYAHERLTDEVLIRDFKTLDQNNSGTIEFAEVCQYCATYFEKDFTKRGGYTDPITSVLDHPYDLYQLDTAAVSVAGDGMSGSAVEEALRLCSASAKAHKAMDVIGERIEQNARIATFEEIKISTEMLLGIEMA